MNQKSLKTVELFAGVGGFRVAAEQKGLKTVWANDIDSTAVTVYKDNFGDDSIVLGDIHDYIDSIPDHDILTGGFPCQPFSKAGKKQGIPHFPTITVDDLFAVYARLKDQYDLLWTTTAALDEGFSVDCPIIVAKAHGQILELYTDGIFVLDITDEAQTKGTHWHPNDVDAAIADIEAFMNGKSDYELRPFP